MQDGKNLIIAIILCLMVVVGWSYLGEKMGWAPKQDPQKIEEAQKQQQELAAKQKAEAEAKAQAAANPLPLFEPSEGKDVKISTPLYTATLYTGGGILRSFELDKFKATVERNSPDVNLVNKASDAMAPLGLVINGQPSWSSGQWNTDLKEDITVPAGQTRTVTLTGRIGDLNVVRELTFDASTYAIREKVRLTPNVQTPVSVRVGYTVGADASNAHGGQYDSMRVGWDEGGKLKEETSEDTLKNGVMATGDILWGGAMSTYFLAGVIPANSTGVTFKGVLQNGVYRAALEQAPITVSPGLESVVSVSYWFGPKDRKMMAAASEELAKSVDLGMFSIIAKGLLWILEFFHKYVGNWGVAIILLTILIKVVFWPLTAKSYSSMEKMKELGPMMQKIKDKYKDDKEAMNKEVMALYKTYGVNPASGCLPLLIQMPVFFGLYQALLTSIELRHADFITYLPFTDKLWLVDLSARDPFYITPIIMGITMLLQQRLTPQAMDPRQQKIMMVLPIVFTFLFLAFPSGLVIYWLCNNVISIGQQWWMLHKGSKKKHAKAR